MNTQKNIIEPFPLKDGIYKTDLFNLKPIFKIICKKKNPNSNLFVKSWEEAYLVHGKLSFNDINPEYIAALIDDSEKASVSPYKRISRLDRSSKVHIKKDNTFHTSKYDPFEKSIPKMGMNELREFIKVNFSNRLKELISDESGFIGCEHSSGIDSNTIIGSLIKDLKIGPEKIHTCSFGNLGESQLISEFQKFHGLRINNCHNLKISTLLENESELLKIFRAPPQVGRNLDLINIFRNNSCKCIMSGFGGDEGISYNGANVPTDLVSSLRFKELLEWSGSLKQMIRVGSGRAWGLLFYPFAKNKIINRQKSSCKVNILKESLTPEGIRVFSPYFKSNYQLRRDVYITSHQLIKRRIMSDFVATRVEEETRLAKFYGIKKYFPMLNQHIIGTLLNQDPLIFCPRKGQGRSLIRSTFKYLLPEFLIDNPTKKRYINEEEAETSKKKVLNSLNIIITSLNDRHPYFDRFWNFEYIKKYCDENLNRRESTLHDLIEFRRIILKMSSLNFWFKSLD